MTDEAQGSHQGWDELVAASALHALEPDDELRLLGHLDGCAPCRAHLDQYRLVAAQLGSLTDDDAQPPAWGDMRSRLVGPPSAAAPAGNTATPKTKVIPLRRRVGVRVLAAAAVVVVAAGVAASWQASRPARDTSASVALTACRQQSGCRVVPLHGQSRDNAAVLVEGGHASLVPVNLSALPADHVYVLWQLPRDGGPIPVVTFRDPQRQTSSVPLMTGYADTAAFAISVEDAGLMPTHPTDLIGLGAATS